MGTISDDRVALLQEHTGRLQAIVSDAYNTGYRAGYEEAKRKYQARGLTEVFYGRVIDDYSTDPNETPYNHMCVVEYLAKYHPSDLDGMDETPDATQRDGFKLTHMYRAKFGHSPPKVTAPRVLQRQGVDDVNVYPINMLRDRFGVPEIIYPF